MDVTMSQTTQVFSNVVFCFELKKNVIIFIIQNTMTTLLK